MTAALRRDGRELAVLRDGARRVPHALLGASHLGLVEPHADRLGAGGVVVGRDDASRIAEPCAGEPPVEVELEVVVELIGRRTP